MHCVGFGDILGHSLLLVGDLSFGDGNSSRTLSFGFEGQRNDLGAKRLVSATADDADGVVLHLDLAAVRQNGTGIADILQLVAVEGQGDVISVVGVDGFVGVAGDLHTDGGSAAIVRSDVSGGCECVAFHRGSGIGGIRGFRLSFHRFEGCGQHHILCRHLENDIICQLTVDGIAVALIAFRRGNGDKHKVALCSLSDRFLIFIHNGNGAADQIRINGDAVGFGFFLLFSGAVAEGNPAQAGISGILNAEGVGQITLLVLHEAQLHLARPVRSHHIHGNLHNGAVFRLSIIVRDVELVPAIINLSSIARCLHLAGVIVLHDYLVGSGDISGFRISRNGHDVVRYTVNPVCFLNRHDGACIGNDGSKRSILRHGNRGIAGCGQTCNGAVIDLGGIGFAVFICKLKVIIAILQTDAQFATADDLKVRHKQCACLAAVLGAGCNDDAKLLIVFHRKGAKHVRNQHIGIFVLIIFRLKTGKLNHLVIPFQRQGNGHHTGVAVQICSDRKGVSCAHIIGKGSSKGNCRIIRRKGRDGYQTEYHRKGKQHRHGFFHKTFTPFVILLGIY